MITWELILAVSVYNFVMYVTPGPNNTILTTSGIKFGFFKTIPNLFGIPSGHGLQLCLVCLGLGTLFVKFQTWLTYFSWCVEKNRTLLMHCLQLQYDYIYNNTHLYL